MNVASAMRCYEARHGVGIKVRARARDDGRRRRRRASSRRRARAECARGVSVRAASGRASARARASKASRARCSVGACPRAVRVRDELRPLLPLLLLLRPPTRPFQALVQVAQGYRERGPAALAWLYVLLAGSDIVCDVFLSMRVRRLSIAL